MITRVAQMATGLAARVGAGPVVRLAVLGLMSWVVWWVAWRLGVPLHGWAQRQLGLGFVELIPPVVVGVGVLVAFVAAADERCLGLADMVRRAPFLCWRLMTDDGDDVALWAVLVWPLAVPVEVAVCACLLVALIAAALIYVAGLCLGAVWRVLSIRLATRRKAK